MNQAVFTSFDENYSDYALVMVKTFCENYHGDPIDLYCLVPEDIQQLQQEYIEKCGNPNNVVIRFVTLEKQKQIQDRFSDDDVSISYITLQCFHRIFIADSFPDLDVAIYIDPDTIILRDVQSLIDYPLASVIAARSESIDDHKISVVGVDGIYFNNGVYKTDLNFWRSEQLADKMLDRLTTHGITLYPEQDLMNIFLAGHVAELPINFNFSSWLSTIGFFSHTVPNPMILHFAGPDKPWKNHSLEKNWTAIWRSKYEEIFGDKAEHIKDFENLYTYDMGDK
jgi:lipopolysaccharide biosynthesis glycosyltransferase